MKKLGLDVHGDRKQKQQQKQQKIIISLLNAYYTSFKRTGSANTTFLGKAVTVEKHEQVFLKFQKNQKKMRAKKKERKNEHLTKATKKKSSNCLFGS